MSRRRPDPFRASLEDALRAALHVAADSVEPAADGFERIRARISAGQGTRRARWRSLAAGGDGPAWPGPGRWLGLLGTRLGRLTGPVAERFRPDPARAGRLGWLRPAAAAATALFVVAAVSWLIIGLPQVIQPTTATNGLSGGRGTGPGVSVPASPRRTKTSATGVPGQGPPPYGQPSPSASCTPGQGPQGISPTGSPSGSASPSASQSPSASSSPSASPTGSQTPASSLSAAPSAASSAAPLAGILGALLASPAPSTASPSPSGPATMPASSPSPGAPTPGPSGTSPSPTPSSSTSPGQCGSS